jgi:hypothetical protein
MICIYVAVGQRASAVGGAIEAVRAHGAPERCISWSLRQRLPPAAMDRTFCRFLDR